MGAATSGSGTNYSTSKCGLGLALRCQLLFAQDQTDSTHQYEQHRTSLADKLGAYDVEHSGVRPHAERQRNDYGRGESRLATHAPKCIGRILTQVVEMFARRCPKDVADVDPPHPGYIRPTLGPCIKPLVMQEVILYPPFAMRISTPYCRSSTASTGK